MVRDSSSSYWDECSNYWDIFTNVFSKGCAISVHPSKCSRYREFAVNQLDIRKFIFRIVFR